MRWDVTRAEGGLGNAAGSHVTVHTHVPFTKSTMWRKIIEKSVTESTLESLNMWRDLVRHTHNLCTAHADDAHGSIILSDDMT